MEQKRSIPQPLYTILQYTCLTIKLFYCKFINLLTFIEVKTIIFFAKMVCSPFTLFEVYGHTLSGWTSVVNRQSSCHLKKWICEDERFYSGIFLNRYDLKATLVCDRPDVPKRSTPLWMYILKKVLLEIILFFHSKEESLT